MLMTDLLARKKRGEALSDAQIRWWITGYVAGAIPDYQVAALLMAISLRGMSSEETLALTMAMTHSGDTVDLSGIAGVKVDKHSTGGVGDTTTLIAGPLAAACGIKVPKMSGRGLGHTGGTIDKLESIPGFNTSLPPAEFVRIVNEVGIAITGQTGNLVPADKLLYALRDVTATVDSLPLIASSIMSKKLAAGADAILLDVKVGSGAFLQSRAEARALAAEMVAIGEGAGRRTVALLTDMNQPLGSAVGNALEVWEAIEVLRGGELEGDLTTAAQRAPLQELSLMLAAEMLLAGRHQTAGCDSNPAQARAAVEHALSNGSALATFRRMVEAQGGNPSVIDDPRLLPQTAERIPVLSATSGYVTSMDTIAIGRVGMLIGGGRAQAGDPIDHATGINLVKRIGDWVQEGEKLATLHVRNDQDSKEAMRLISASIALGDSPPTQHVALATRLSPRP